MTLGTDLLVAVANGIVWGTIIALLSLGLNLIFGLIGIVNISHGALYMIGAVLTYVVNLAIGNFVIAVAIAALLVGVLGVGMERGVLRPIVDDVPRTVIATFGFMLIIEELTLLTFGPTTRTIAAPITASVELAGVTYPMYRVAVAAVAVVIMVGLYLFLYRTRYGLWFRSVQQDREMALALGIPTSRIFALTFGIGALLAGLAGGFLAPIVSVNYLMGLDILITVFIVVMVGGIGSLRGALLASLLYGLLENVGSVFVSSTEATLITLALMTTIVLLRPEGLLVRGSV